MNIFVRKSGITIDSVARTSIDLANEKNIWSFTKLNHILIPYKVKKEKQRCDDVLT